MTFEIQHTAKDYLFLFDFSMSCAFTCLVWQFLEKIWSALFLQHNTARKLTCNQCFTIVFSAGRRACIVNRNFGQHQAYLMSYAVMSTCHAACDIAFKKQKLRKNIYFIFKLALPITSTNLISMRVKKGNLLL